MNKLQSVGVNALLTGGFGGVICVIKESLFDDEKTTSFRRMAKTFWKGFVIGAALGGTSELFYYDRREKFKEQVFENYYQQRRAAESQGRY